MKDNVVISKCGGAMLEVNSGRSEENLTPNQAHCKKFVSKSDTLENFIFKSWNGW